MCEAWRDIVGFDGYQVSNFGNVRTYNKVTYTKRHGIRRWKNRILKQKVRKDNCHQVDLWLDGKPTTQYVHRLVAEAFINKPSNDMTVNHKDGDRSNNHVENLEWISLGDNIRHGFDNNLYRTQNNCVLIREDGREFYFNSWSSAGRFLGKSQGYIGSCIKHNRKIKDSNGNDYQYRRRN